MKRKRRKSHVFEIVVIMLIFMFIAGINTQAGSGLKERMSSQITAAVQESIRAEMKGISVQADNE